MKTNRPLEKLGFDKLVLLGFLVLSLIIARFIVVSKSKIEWSRPINLKYTGLKMAIPTGSGWKHKNLWKYSSSSYTLASDLSTRSGGQRCIVMYTYMISPDPNTSEEFFRKTGTELQKTIIEKDTIRKEGLGFNWAKFKSSEDSLDTYYIAKADLGHGHQLKIEVFQSAVNFDIAEKVFFDAIERLQYSQPAYFETSKYMISEFRDKGLRQLLYRHPLTSIFVKSDKMNNKLGFNKENIKFKAEQPEYDFTMDFYLFNREPIIIEKLSQFHCNNNIGTFEWKTQHQSANIARNIILQKKEEKLIVNQFQPTTKKRTLQLTGLSFPDMMLDTLLPELLESSSRKFYIDVIDENGFLVPVFITKDIPAEFIPKGDEKSALMVRLLTDSNFRQIVYFDSNDIIIRKILLHEKTYFLERTDRETILEAFPEREEFLNLSNENLI